MERIPVPGQNRVDIRLRPDKQNDKYQLGLGGDGTGRLAQHGGLARGDKKIWAGRVTLLGALLHIAWKFCWAERGLKRKGGGGDLKEAVCRCRITGLARWGGAERFSLKAKTVKGVFHKELVFETGNDAREHAQALKETIVTT